MVALELRGREALFVAVTELGATEKAGQGGIIGGSRLVRAGRVCAAWTSVPGMTPGQPGKISWHARRLPRYDRDPRVDAYIGGLPGWQQEICEQLRVLIHSVDPEMTETIKRRDRPYFVLNGNVCALLAAKDHVNLFLYDGAIVPDPERIITGGHNNKTARRIAYQRGGAIKERPLAAMLKQIVANNRAGGWRKLKTT